MEAATKPTQLDAPVPGNIDDMMEEATAKDDNNEIGKDCGSGYGAWFNHVCSNGGELFNKIKADFVEVACAASNEPKEVMQRTAHNISDKLANAWQSLEGDTPRPEDYKDVDLDHLRQSFSGMMANLSSGISSVSHLGQDYIKSYLLPPTQDDADEELIQLEKQPTSACASKEVKFQIMRADVMTYTTVPEPVDGACSYEDWYNAYFNDLECQPRQGVPLRLSRDDTTASVALAPPHPTPAQILDMCPPVRAHLHRLVDHELGLKRSDDPKRISEVDFWSRYYYRVWCLEISEARRKRLLERVSDPSGERETARQDVEQPKEEEFENASSSGQTEASNGEQATSKSDSVVLVDRNDVKTNPTPDVSEDEFCEIPAASQAKDDDEEKTCVKRSEPTKASNDEGEEDDDWENWS